ncbi:MAG: YegS/Rv2252/BmrU family lipid kinase [Dehalococcoidia bacterium]
MTTALLIRNPIARRRLSEAHLAAIRVIAEKAGWTIDVVATDCAGAATRIAREAAAAGVDVVVVHGGDGTLNEAINGLAGSSTAVAVLRGGTANIWAKETHGAKDPVRSMRAIVTGVRRRVDLGRAGDRYFLLMCGVGLDARIVEAVGPRMKRWLGAAAYVVAGVVQALRTRAWPADVTIDGDASERALYFMLVSNTRLYGGVTQISYRAVADDAELDVALMRRGGVMNLVRDGARMVFKRHDRSPNVRFGRARAIEIATPGIPVQVDGEAAGETPIRIEVAPLALHVIVPSDLRSPLFGRAPEASPVAGS